MTSKRKLARTSNDKGQVEKKAKLSIPIVGQKVSKTKPSQGKHKRTGKRNRGNESLLGQSVMSLKNKDKDAKKNKHIPDSARPGPRSQISSMSESNVQNVEGATKLKPIRKKNFKKKHKKHQVNNPSPTGHFEKINLPKAPEEVSSNWKDFLKTNPTVRRKSKGKEHKQTGPAKRVPHLPQYSQPSGKTGPEIWFDDVDEILIEGLKKTREVPTVGEEPSAEKSKLSKRNPLVRPQSFSGLTKVVAMDCEMVGVGEKGKDSVLARVSLVNQFGLCIYDKYVKPTEEVTDFRTCVSGIRPENVEKGEEFTVVQKEVSDIIKGRILVGHAVMNDLKVLYLSHSKKKIRDTSRYRPFRQLSDGRTPGLKKLCQKVLGVEVQEGEHSSVQDAQGAMRLYTLKKKEWEKSIRDRASMSRKNIVTSKGKSKVKMRTTSGK